MARVCAEPGCPDIADRTYCAKHKRERNRDMKRSPAGEWASTQYKTKRWQKRRAAQLAAHPYCQCPYHEGKRVPATIADHVEPHRGDPRKFWRGKLQSLTKHCHDSWKQRQERSAMKHWPDWSDWTVSGAGGQT